MDTVRSYVLWDLKSASTMESSGYWGPKGLLFRHTLLLGFPGRYLKMDGWDGHIACKLRNWRLLQWWILCYIRFSRVKVLKTIIPNCQPSGCSISLWKSLATQPEMRNWQICRDWNPLFKPWRSRNTGTKVGRWLRTTPESDNSAALRAHYIKHLVRSGFISVHHLWRNLIRNF